MELQTGLLQLIHLLIIPLQTSPTMAQCGWLELAGLILQILLQLLTVTMELIGMLDLN